MPIEIEKHIDNVYRFALSLTNDRHEAEELTQECFLRACTKLEQIKNPSQTKSWLFQILVNLRRDRFKKKKLDVCKAEVHRLLDTKNCPETRIEIQEENDSILQMMKSLPKQQQTILFLSAVEQLSNTEISQLLQTTENAVKANLSIARKTMRKKLAANVETRQANTQ